MSEYYAVVRSTDHLMHYGVLGMKWGVRRQARKLAREQKKIEKKIDKNSNSLHGTWISNYKDHSQGYFHAPNSNKNSERYKLFNKMCNEYEKMKRKEKTYDGTQRSEEIWNYLGKKYQPAYLKAILNDAKITVNKKNLETAHKLVSAKDREYARFNQNWNWALDFDAPSNKTKKKRR